MSKTANNAQLTPSSFFWNPAKPTLFEMVLAASQFPLDCDCDVWLRHNRINTPEMLADLHYALYHRCSKGVFKVTKCSDRKFEIAADNSTLIISNDAMRRYMNSQLRKLTVRVMRKAWCAGTHQRPTDE